MNTLRLATKEGYLAVVEIEHDVLTADESLQIKKGMDMHYADDELIR